MKKNISLLVFLSMWALVACVQVPVEKNSRANQLAISSVRDLPVSYPEGSIFSLSPKYVKETSLKTEQTQAIYQFYSRAIVRDLQNNGFVNTLSAVQPAFYVGFGLALTDDFSDDIIIEKFGISPGLSEQNNLMKGSFLIYIEDASTGEQVWRGIAQAFAHKDLSAEQRKQRTERVVSEVMKQFYQTN